MNPKVFTDDGLRNVIDAAQKELRDRQLAQDAQNASEKITIAVVELTKIRDELRRKPRVVEQYQGADDLRQAITTLEDAVHKFWDAVHEAEKVKD